MAFALEDFLNGDSVDGAGDVPVKKGLRKRNTEPRNIS